MPRPRKYPPSWIDDEGFKPAAYKWLRELVVVYQTKEELVKHLNTNGWLVYHGPSSKIINEINKWLEKQSIEEQQHDDRWVHCKDGHDEAVQRINREINAKEKRENIIIPTYDEHKFDLFVKAQKRLLKKYKVSIDADCDGNIVVRSVTWKRYSAAYVDDWLNEIVKR